MENDKKVIKYSQMIKRKRIKYSHDDKVFTKRIKICSQMIEKG